MNIVRFILKIVNAASCLNNGSHLLGRTAGRDGVVKLVVNRRCLQNTDAAADTGVTGIFV